MKKNSKGSEGALAQNVRVHGVGGLNQLSLPLHVCGLKEHCSLSLSTYTYTDIDSAKKNQVQRINSIFYPRKLNSRCDPPRPIGSLGPKPFFGCLVVVLWDEPMNLTMTSRRFRHHPSYLKGLWISTIQPEKTLWKRGYCGIEEKWRKTNVELWY